MLTCCCPTAHVCLVAALQAAAPWIFHSLAPTNARSMPLLSCRLVCSPGAASATRPHAGLLVPTAAGPHPHPHPATYTPDPRCCSSFFRPALPISAPPFPALLGNQISTDSCTCQPPPCLQGASMRGPSAHLPRRLQRLVLLRLNRRIRNQRPSARFERHMFQAAGGTGTRDSSSCVAVHCGVLALKVAAAAAPQVI